MRAKLFLGPAPKSQGGRLNYTLRDPRNPCPRPGWNGIVAYGHFPGIREASCCMKRGNTLTRPRRSLRVRSSTPRKRLHVTAAMAAALTVGLIAYRVLFSFG